MLLIFVTILLATMNLYVTVRRHSTWVSHVTIPLGQVAQFNPQFKMIDYHLVTMLHFIPLPFKLKIKYYNDLVNK